MKDQQYQSFLVRLWWEDSGGEPEPAWYGEIESIQTGQKWQISDLETLFHFYESETGFFPGKSQI